jgi:DNA-directed RNA polymerase alpha subunit
MELTLEKKHENRIEFLIDGMSTGFANTLRRYAMNRVPVLAMDTVTFYDNTTSMWDEYIAHRLGLMPVFTPEDFPKEGEVVFSIDETGPKVVYSKDFKSSDKEIKIAQDDIVVVTLGQGQHIRLEAKARLGIGVQHAKYQAGLVSYGVENGKLRMMVESFYHMPPVRILLTSCDEIDSDISTILEALGEKPARKAKKEKKEKKEPAKKKAAKKKEKE